jgi:outer membrane protein TolC
MARGNDRSAARDIEGVLAIPIWDGGARYGELRQAKAEKDEADQNLIAARRARASTRCSRSRTAAGERPALAGA